jgi:hypothetical protein
MVATFDNYTGENETASALEVLYFIKNMGVQRKPCNVREIDGKM